LKKLLITGISGLVGRALAKNCASRFEIYGTYHSRDFKPGFPIIPLDLRNAGEIESVIDQIQPPIVIHTGGLTDLQYCQSHPQETEDINYRATAQLAAFCAQRGIRLIYLSSDMIFDGTKGNYTETDVPHPLNQYGRSKFAAEEAIKSICENYAIIRLNLVFGHGEAVKKTFTDRILIASWCSKPYPIFKGQVRSPISLDVASRVIREIAEGEFRGIFHLGGLESIDRWDFAIKLIAFLHIDPTISKESSVPEEFKEFYPLNTSFDITKARTELKTELLTIEEGLKLEYGKYMD
jgi:dTDP-4-dehydrorhamnose reductase